MNHQKRVLVITDCSDIAYNELFATLSNELELSGVNARIDPPVFVECFSIINTAFSIRLMSELYREGDVILVVVNATSDGPDRIFGQFENGVFFVGNNSGYFGWSFASLGLRKVFANNYTRKTEARAFGGKYAQAPVAARLAAGVSPTELGSPYPEGRLKAWPLTDGLVVHIDNFGLAKMYVESPITGLDDGDIIKISAKEKGDFIATYTTSMKKWPNGTCVFYPGSSLFGLPELAVVRDRNSAKTLNLTIGDEVSWTRQ